MKRQILALTITCMVAVTGFGLYRGRSDQPSIEDPAIIAPASAMASTPTRPSEADVVGNTDDVPDWYSSRVKAAILAGREASPTECTDPGLICDQTDFAPVMDVMRPSPMGPITTEDAVGRALMLADSPVQALDAKIGVLATTWSDSARIGGFSVESDIRLDPQTPVVVVTVYATITNTDVPAGIDPQVYDSYTVIYSTASRHGFRTCYGCSDLPPTARAKDIVSALPS